MKSLSLILILFSIIFTGCKEKSDWKQWRGPNGDNVSTETGWSVEKLDSSNILWKKVIGFGHGAFVVSADNCYITGWKQMVNNSDTTSASSIYCLNTKSGEQIWSFSSPTAKRGWTGPRSTPAIDGNNIYFLNEEGKLFSLDAGTGKENWKVDLAGDSIAVVNEWGYAPSPVIAGDLILFNMNTSGLALNKNTGKVVWTSERKIGSHATAKLFKFNGKQCAIFQADTTIRIVNIADGKIELAYPKHKSSTLSNDVQITRDGNIYASDEYILVNNGELKLGWRVNDIASWFLTGVIVGDYAYQYGTAKGKNLLCCIEVKTGEVKWSENLGQFGQLIAVNNKLMIISGLGKVIIADASPLKFNKLTELQVLSSENKEENRCFTAPVFIDGKLFIRNFKGEVACINLKK
jgi:outer membrane protein assembly factor BamB